MCHPSCSVLRVSCDRASVHGPLVEGLGKRCEPVGALVFVFKGHSRGAVLDAVGLELLRGTACRLVLPRPARVLRDGVVAHRESGDRLAAGARNDDLHIQIVVFALDAEHEGLVRGNVLAGLRDRQVERVDVHIKLIAAVIRILAAGERARVVAERNHVRRNIPLADPDRHLDAGILRERRRLGAVCEDQLGCLADHVFRIRRRGVMFPDDLRGVEIPAVIRALAEIHARILHSDHRLVHTDRGRCRGRRFYSCRAGGIGRSGRLGPNRRRRRIYAVARHVNGAVRRVSNIDKREIISSGVIRNTQLIGRRLRAQIIDIAVRAGQRRRQDRNICLRNIEQAGRNTLVRIDAGGIAVGRHIVAANEAGAALDHKFHDELLPVGAARVARLFRHVVLVEVKAGDAHGPALGIDGRLNIARLDTRAERRACARAVCRIHMNVARVFGKCEIRRHNVPDNRLAVKVDIGAADILADGRKDLVQRRRVVRRQIIAGGCALEVLRDLVAFDSLSPPVIIPIAAVDVFVISLHLRLIKRAALQADVGAVEVGREVVEETVACRDIRAHKIVAFAVFTHVGRAPELADLAGAGENAEMLCGHFVAIELARVCSVENADRIHRHAGIFHCLGAVDGRVGNRCAEVALRRRNAVRKDDDDLLTVFVAALVIGAGAAHQCLRLLHAGAHIGRALRLLRKFVDFRLELGLTGLFCIRFRRGHKCPAGQRGGAGAECHDGDPVIGLGGVILAGNRLNEVADGLLHGILAAGRIRAGLIPCNLSMA